MNACVSPIVRILQTGAGRLRSYEAQFNHFPSLSAAGPTEQWMEKDCISFQQTVTLWVSVEREGFQEAAVDVVTALCFLHGK